MNTNENFCLEKFTKTPVIGILRNLDINSVLFLAETYLEADFHTLEVTMNTQGAAHIISSLRKEFPQLNVGAGTVCNLNELNQSLDAGSQFTVTPIINKEVLDKCVNSNIPVFPGAYTPTEVYQAWSWGATAVKVFPATQLGPTYIKDVLAPLNQVNLLPTGGVTKNNIADFINAGAIGVGMGSSIFSKKLVLERNQPKLLEHFQSIKSNIPLIKS
ncbi:bifunctional 4-hydroxy-2-oxoglutarate aldolase/2-dehydro-3-deoxy-phosphogluconate aldolase [Cytophaga sp. FL35]|uniref:bifunctional 4-hydroxy-2-oxoglutarate aldolase/2-dehydro-3-deoxy-phosphogluconate aldolase n=1 Tax=Cytophaga sp. FL35 TaxID=1904456 RepID=UPI0016534549|nr:bifunctional 4-hydroxy-2-oxoglutarate aldolase/2-dehydro-3-deoxy-phosphogluconate aldolase [Cytophaga sp. FL35]MBC6998031.1 bifunctional 4-hydroxy-2-oxoglutarate aldolase/2-dehydro-3-deoxy-phosphogluconate aldolase [Cytophaga sp. FL35]